MPAMRVTNPETSIQLLLYDIIYVVGIYTSFYLVTGLIWHVFVYTHFVICSGEPHSCCSDYWNDEMYILTAVDADMPPERADLYWQGFLYWSCMCNSPEGELKLQADFEQWQKIDRYVIRKYLIVGKKSPNIWMEFSQKKLNPVLFLFFI